MVPAGGYTYSINAAFVHCSASRDRDDSVAVVHDARGDALAPTVAFSTPDSKRSGNSSNNLIGRIVPVVMTDFFRS